MTEAHIFDRKARRMRRDRMLTCLPADKWLIKRMADELIARAGEGMRRTSRTLLIGVEPSLSAALRSRGDQVVIVEPSLQLASACSAIQGDEDFLPIRDGSCDLVVAIGTLDTVNDLPGALILAKRALRPGGRFIGAMMGADSLALLRQVHVNSATSPRAVLRFHPQVDVRAAGDLLSRAGFAEPVADMEMIAARYGSLDRLLGDLRANGLSNVLSNRFALSRSELAAWREAFRALADDDGRNTETFCPIYLSGKVG